jgi:hypothetical protein
MLIEKNVCDINRRTAKYGTARTAPKLNMKIILEADGKSILPSHTYSTVHSPGPGLALQ